MPTTPYLPQPPPQMASNLSQTDYNWQLIVQGLAPLFEVDTSKGSYAESVPAAGVNPANPATGQSAQGKEIIYVKTSADSNTYTLNGVQGGTLTISRQYQVIRIKSDGTNWWPIQTSASSGLALQVNGTPNLDQSLLNLFAGSGVTLTDAGAGKVIIAASGGGGNTFNTAGQGYFFGAKDLAPVQNSSGNGVPTNNVVVCVQLLLESTWVISQVAMFTITGASAKTLVSGIYSANGNTKLVDSGAMVYGATSQETTLVDLGAPVTIPPGVYYWAFGTLDNVTGASVLLHDVNEALGGLLNNWSFAYAAPVPPIRVGTAANPIIGGVLPATLGTITPFTGGTNVSPYVVIPPIPAVLFLV